MSLTYDLREQIISWAIDCVWVESSDDIADLSDLQIIKAVNRHYIGGLSQFIEDLNG